MSTFLGIIPARGGSKRLPGKNIAPLAGKPLIAWTIEAAKKSMLDSFLVSTDSREIADIAHEYGAWVPFLRPRALATDEAKTVDVLRHAVKYAVEKCGIKPDYIVTLQPTTPTRTERDINVAVEFMDAMPLECFFTCREEEPKPNGNIYVTAYDLLMKDSIVWHTWGAIWPQIEAAYPDIDTEEDFKMAEELLCKR
jgi:CMP-N-acetylneuraminic acid synthetase